MLPNLKNNKFYVWHIQVYFIHRKQMMYGRNFEYNKPSSKTRREVSGN